MPPSNSTCRITATHAARVALDGMRSMHGGIALHVPAGCCDVRMPLCLRLGELRLGAWDTLLGMVEGVPVYKMQNTTETNTYCDEFVLDTVPGMASGFSLDIGGGMKFSLIEAAN